MHGERWVRKEIATSTGIGRTNLSIVEEGSDSFFALSVQSAVESVGVAWPPLAIRSPKGTILPFENVANGLPRTKLLSV